MNQDEMKQRTRQYSLQIIELCKELPNDYVALRIGDQLLRAGTSVGANYRAACRGRSTKEFIAKLGTVEEEADESLYWIELLAESKIVPRDTLAGIWREGNEILSIIVATIKTTKGKQGK
ncbi:MAG: four helix bundle protein [Candidatus Promineifilaceae bacterium]|jgi:four helix bundle protein